MMSDAVLIEIEDEIALITLNRPQRLNALNYELIDCLVALLHRLEVEASVRAIILTGAGERAFSAGNDLKWTATHGMPRMPKGGFGGIVFRDDIWKPLIAAVNGVALGGGLEIALACDIIVASDNARLGLPEPRVGLMAAAGGVHRLPRSVPLKVAMGMMLTGRQIPAAEAARIGLVNEVVPQAQLMAAAERWANEILECSPLSVQASKQAALQGLAKPLTEAMAGDYPLVQKLWRSEDVVEGPRAFAEKRKPVWKGR